ncbi:MAG: ABC transporter ATP-binding protein, partial [Clostridia bacterium]|nr:ABC transporter ATP-binding protein [Clostridia bacterium]
ILRLLPEQVGKITSGSIKYNGIDILSASKDQMRELRGAQISMIFQDPMTALNPMLTVGDQIAEVIRLHQNVTKAEAFQRAKEMMEVVGIEGGRANEYPHQFSGGMKQRIVIAIALACNPSLLIADEPTTALDVTIQAQVLELIEQLKRKYDTSLLLITHDLGVVAEVCNKVAIIYAGEIVEYGTLAHIYKNPSHPYTIGLFGTIPNLNETVTRLKPIPGLMPDPTKLPEGCAFAERCGEACEKCMKGAVPYIEIEPGHMVRCTKFAGKEN